jgi:hypothetical protein
VTSTSTLSRPDRRTRPIAFEHARELLAQAATLHLDHGRLLVRCRLGHFAGWWDLDEALQLLHLGHGYWEVEGEGGRHLAVADGVDLYRFDVS